MELHELLRFIHILGAVIWVGGVIVLNAVVTKASRRADRSAVIRLNEELDWVGPWIISPAATVMIGLGVWLVLLEDEWAFSQLWIVLALVLVGMSMVLGMGYLGPEGKRISTLVKERGDADPDARRRMGRLLWVARLDVLILLVVLWAMVFKPGA
ncbi:MAG: DUF2269 family protein [Actinobacteria bacterium]|nr:DUF2269 family protein [Actinomycetota bacterium]